MVCIAALILGRKWYRGLRCDDFSNVFKCCFLKAKKISLSLQRSHNMFILGMFIF